MHQAPTPAAPLPCPGRPSPARPVAVVPVCRGCPLWLRGADFGPHQRPVAEHDGERWRCERRPRDDEAATPAAADTVVSEEMLAMRPAPLGPGVATRRGDFFP